MPRSRLPAIGVTGITGSGTSTVAGIMAGRGGFVVHADKLAHEIMARAEPAYAEIVSAFGREILAPSGEISRRALGARVFGNREELARLEGIIHPRVIDKTRDLISAAAGGYTFAVIDAPLLIESGMNSLCDSIWLVTAPDELRLARIIARDGLDAKTAARRLNSRSGDSSLRPFANVIIQNDGSPEALRSKVVAALRAMTFDRGWRGLDVLTI